MNEFVFDVFCGKLCFIGIKDWFGKGKEKKNLV